MAETILVVDDDEGMLDVCEVGLRMAGYSVSTVASGDAALALLESESFDLVITDLQMPGKTDGHGVVLGVKTRHPATEVIVMTGAPTIATAVATLKDGAYDYVLKPFDVEHLKAVARRCLDHRRLRQDLTSERAMRQELATAYQELQKVEQLKEAFLARVSHELQTPLSELLIALHLLKESLAQSDASRQQECFQLAGKGAKRLENTISDLLAFVYVQHSPVLGQVSEVDLDALLRELSERLKPVWEPRRVEISLAFVEGARRVPGDPELLSQAFRHLLHNAVVFNREGGKVSVRGEVLQDRVAVTVSDTGEGIPESEFQKVFDSFYQIANYLTRKVDGLGLGLAITRRIVEAHGGSIRVSSRLGEGANFTVVLPQAEKQSGTPSAVARA